MRILQVYGGLSYKLALEFPHSYPYSAPVVRFITPCFHPNVDSMGNICLDILKDKWSALYDVRTILLSIQSLLGGEYWDSVTHDLNWWEVYVTDNSQRLEQMNFHVELVFDCGVVALESTLVLNVWNNNKRIELHCGWYPWLVQD